MLFPNSTRNHAITYTNNKNNNNNNSNNNNIKYFFSRKFDTNMKQNTPACKFNHTRLYYLTSVTISNFNKLFCLKKTPILTG